MKSLVICLIGFIFIAGCTNAGPYVTDIAFDGEGNLLITKNTVVHDAFLGVIHNGEQPQTVVIKMPKGYLSGQDFQGYKATIDPNTGKTNIEPQYKK